MDIARTLLCLGENPSTLARHLGYADAQAFSRVFTQAHGIPPRAYQRRELHRP